MITVIRLLLTLTLALPACAATSTRTVDMDAFGRKCVLCHADHRRYQEAMGDLYACGRCHEDVTKDLRAHDIRKFAFSQRYTRHEP